MKKKSESKIRTFSNGNAKHDNRNEINKISDESAAKCTKGSASGLHDLKTPPRFPVSVAVISLVTFLLRVCHVLDRANWVTIHPDEVFQSMEVAHSEHYGYGFRPYEFTSSFEDIDNNNATQYRQMELDAGLSAMRSPIFPYYYVIVAEMTSFMGLYANPYLVFRLAHVVVTSLLPMSVYFYCTYTFHSVDVAVVSAVLASCSIHLNVLGTHCFIQSFLSPIVFLTMAVVASINDVSKKDRVAIGDSGIRENDQKESNTVPIDGNNNFTSGCNRTPMKNKKNGSIMEPTVSNVDPPHDRIHSIYRPRKNDAVTLTTKYKSVSCKSVVIGFLIGITCYIRPDVILIYFANFLHLISTSFHQLSKFQSQALMIFVGLSTSLIFGVMVDTAFYGGYVVTPWNWIDVNIIQNISTSVYGKMDFWYYFKMFYSGDTVMCRMYLLSLFIYVTLMMIVTFRKTSDGDPLGNNRVTLSSCLVRFIVCCVFLVVIFSCHGHKEVRFVHDTVVFLVISSSLVINNLFAILDIDVVIRRVILVFLLATLWAFQSYRFYNQTSTTQWTYQHAPDTQHTNVCLEFISHQPDVSGVFLEDNIFLTGGMTIIHKDVPIFSRVMDGFFEFDMDSRINTTSSRFSRFVSKNEKNLLSLNVFSRVSNYVSLANGAGILRGVLEKQEYNYFVLTKDRPFKKMGFRQVFQSYNRRVLKRVGDPDSERQISHVVDRLPLGTDVKTLIHEGDVLFHMKQYQKATERFQQAINLSPQGTDSIGAYLPLYECLQHLGRQADGMKVMEHCIQRHGKDTCLAQRRMTRLHD